MEISKKYDHSGIEKKWYGFWEESGFFKADPESTKPPYSIVIPPPNVTGVLHLGHALTVTIQDIMSRFKRMDGYDVLWLPGTDHAGIATQIMVERNLKDTTGQSRHDIGREKFLEKAWEWKEKHKDGITSQLRAMGTSLDWTRERFTMDEGLSKAVKEVFVRLYEEGLIYRDDYIINWCPHDNTALSDLEVEYGDEQGSLWYLKYPVKDMSGTYLTVATTRPETMLGDTAVAVHPDDERFRHLIGKSVLLPLMNREIPIIGDAELVDMEFGTGAVKVTPAHDFNDFATGQRHGLQMINVIDGNAKINDKGGKYCGFDVLEAREKVVADLDSMGLLEKIEKHAHQVGHCDRCKTVVQPILSKQWFVKIKPLAEPAIKVVEEGRIAFNPKHWEKTYYEWMYNIRDWCISRQLWWGHQIPAWHCDDCRHTVVSRDIPEKCPLCEGHLTQDPDVLDTWFSSALWPFSTMGWPGKTPELTKYYPTSLMETAPDIIFFWVARMIMMGMKFMGDIPFEKVFFHGLIVDEKGQKMSKTKGNGIDPMEMIAKYGADALRFTFAMMPVTQRHIKLGEKNIEDNRAFINKIFNAVRFSLMQFKDGEILEFDPVEYKEDDFSFADKWILSRLEIVTAEVNKTLEEMRFNDSAGALYHFFWNEFCDWYIELVKPAFFGTNEKEKEVSKKVLVKVLDASLKLLHPFMPHVTEELWQSLPFKNSGKLSSIMISRFPRVGDSPVFEKDAAVMEQIIEIITCIRTIRSENNIKPSLEMSIMLSLNGEVESAIREKEEYIKKLARVSAIDYVSENYSPDKETASAMVKGGMVFISLSGLVDFTEEIARIEKEIVKIQKDFDLCDRKLSNPGFLEKANPDVIEKEKEKHGELKENLEHLKNRLVEIKK